MSFTLNPEQFNLQDVTFCGEGAVLVTPALQGTDWALDTLKYRSSIWKEGKCLSAGFPKFFNYGEKPSLYPDPSKANDLVIEDKVDGTCVICDWHNGQFNMRTRGTAHCGGQANAADFELLPQKYPKLVDWLRENSGYSVLFELVTPNNVIVIRSEEVTFTLIGCIHKNSYQSLTPSDLDNLSVVINAPRPKYYKFDNVKETVEAVEHWKGAEGVVLVYNKGQSRVKCKSAWYLYLHRIKSQLNSENNLLEYYIEHGRVSYNEFYTHLVDTFDFEIAEQLKPQISRLCDANTEVNRILDHMKEFVKEIKGLHSRKEQADAIIQSYGPTNRASYLFSILDGKELPNSALIKLFWQVLKK